MEPPVCPGIIIPEVVEQMIMIIVVIDLITNIIRPVAELLLTLSATIPTTIRQVGTEIAPIVHTHRLPISTIGDAILPVVRGEVSILSTCSRASPIECRSGHRFDQLDCLRWNHHSHDRQPHLRDH